MTELTLKDKFSVFLDTVWPCRKAVRAINKNTEVTANLSESIVDLNATLIGYNTRIKKSDEDCHGS